MRSSIRLRLMVLMLIPAFALLALSATQLRSSFDVMTQTSRFATLVEIADAQYSLVHDLQIERTRTLEAFFLGDGGSMDMTGDDLATARSATDGSLARLRTLTDTSVLGEFGADVAEAMATALATVDQLRENREQIDAGTQIDAVVASSYQYPIDRLLDVDDALIPNVSNPTIHTRLLATAAYARLKATAVSRGDTVLLGVAGSIDSGTAGRDVAALANQQALWLDSLHRLATPEEIATLDDVASVDASTEVARVVGGMQAGNLGSIAEIAAANRTEASELRLLEQQLAATSAEAAEELGTAASRNAAIIGVAAVAALLLAIYLLIVLSRSVVTPLQRLTRMAGRVAQTLPETVDAVARGEDVDQDLFGDRDDVALFNRRDELGDLARALGAATDQATAVALDQAKTRHGVARTISNVARREQSLVERQLSLLEGMEQREENPEQLAQLFSLDHLATRMRRNAENLLLLSAGQLPGSNETEPLPLVDVIRTAAAETEHYARVDVRVGLPVDVVGYAATPLSHLLAELIENATNFSPPDSRVTVTTAREGAGVTITVTDRGIGMSAEDLAEAKHRLTAPPLLEAAESRRLGLYVVGLLALRLGVAIDLRPGAEGGLEVLAWLPEALFTQPVGDAGPTALTAAVAASGNAPLHAIAAPAPIQETAPAPVPAAAPVEPARPNASLLSEDDTPDALSVMQRLLDATPSAPPPLPADVRPTPTAQLPARSPLLPQRQSGSVDSQASGLSMARASNGRTVELDATQVSALMSGAPAPTAEAGTPVPDRPPVPPSEPIDPQGSAPAPPAATTPPTPTQPARPANPLGGTSSWSTPFPNRDQAQ